MPETHHKAAVIGSFVRFTYVDFFYLQECNGNKCNEVQFLSMHKKISMNLPFYYFKYLPFGITGCYRLMINIPTLILYFLNNRYYSDKIIDQKIQRCREFISYCYDSYYEI